jgi:hypothetical protein
MGQVYSLVAGYSPESNDVSAGDHESAAVGSFHQATTSGDCNRLRTLVRVCM